MCGVAIFQLKDGSGRFCESVDGSGERGSKVILCSNWGRRNQGIPNPFFFKKRGEKRKERNLKINY